MHDNLRSLRYRQILSQHTTEVTEFHIYGTFEDPKARYAAFARFPRFGRPRTRNSRLRIATLALLNEVAFYVALAVY